MYCDVGFDRVSVCARGGVSDGEYGYKVCFQTDRLIEISIFKITFATLIVIMVMLFIFMWR